MSDLCGTEAAISQLDGRSNIWSVGNGSEIHVSTVADDFEGKKVVFPAGYPLSIQTATSKPILLAMLA